MRRLALGAVTGLLALSALVAHAGDTPAPTGTAQDCWLPAFKAGDADAVAACYTEEAVMWFPGGPMAKGREAIRAGYAGYFEAYTIKDVQITELGRDAQGDSVTGWGQFVVVMVAKADGQEVTERGRYTDLSRKVDGRWLYAMDHASDDPPPAEAAPPAVE